MCTIVAKYFKGQGWVLAKNRDQDYVSHISFKDIKDKKVGELLFMYDFETKYKEGMNHKGLVIITTSLTPTLLGESNKKDGDNIETALGMTDPMEAAEFLVKQKMTGYIFCGTPDKLILVEAARTDQGKGEYHSKITEVDKSEHIARTNHGIEFEWAGFQEGINDQQDIWRKSSEMRMQQALKVTKYSKNATEMLEAMASKMAKDLQFNVFRVENKPRQMRTIFQSAYVPSKSVLIIRPIQCKMDVKVSREKIHIEILDNTSLHKLYDGRIKHFSKIVSKNDEEIKTIVQEKKIFGFSDFINY
jgi:hypothetical protein